MSALRARCSGVLPLDGRLEPWQIDLLERPTELAELVERHGSPINLIAPAPMTRNAAELTDAAKRHGVRLEPYFARKANKALSLVDEAMRARLGVDVASERELRQVLERGFDPERVIVTAAIKSQALLELCVASGATVALDNSDELALMSGLASRAGAKPKVAIRLAPELTSGAHTRFGFAHSEALATDRAGLEVCGVHFHLDGYSAGDRVEAVHQAIDLVDALRERGDPIAFVDIGGGIPMSYLESGDQWASALPSLEHGDPALTYDGHPVGRVYPYHQEPVRGQWLDQILASPARDGGTVAGIVSERDLELRCEPGRSLVDGCGMTVARVEFRKQRADGTWLIGLAMNRTQCRSTSDDFSVDPLLVRPDPAGEPSDPIDGFLVGAYCIERELITWRRLRYPEGVAVGDLIAFPNTAGYLMHILESASHQIPLARNLVVDGNGFSLDEIDR